MGLASRSAHNPGSETKENVNAIASVASENRLVHFRQVYTEMFMMTIVGFCETLTAGFLQNCVVSSMQVN